MPAYSEYKKQIRYAASFILEKIGEQPQITIILGSGLSTFADTAFADRKEINYADIPSFPRTTVQGHRGVLYYGHIRGKLCVCFAGRFHSYEGHPPHILTLLPQISSALGCKVYIMTNAAGGTQPGMKVGCLMSIIEHATTTRFNSLSGFEAIGAKHIEVNTNNYMGQFRDISYPFTTQANYIYSQYLIEMAQEIACDPDFVSQTAFELNGEQRTVQLHKGTYIFNAGPNYESHAETARCVKHAPGAVGMSSVPEALCARMLGMHVYGLSLITNLASGLSDEVLTHEDVYHVAGKVSNAVGYLVGNMVERLDVASLEELTPWGEPERDFEMVPKPTAYCYTEAVETLLYYLDTGIVKCIFYPDPIFKAYQSGDTLFISTPRQLNNYQMSLVFKVICKLQITDIKYYVPSLPLNTVVHSQNVINQTGRYVINYIKSSSKLESRLGNRVMLFDTMEDPNSSLFCKNMADALKCRFLSNQVSALPAIFGCQIGTDVLYCSHDYLSLKMKCQVCKYFVYAIDKPKLNLFDVKATTASDAVYINDVQVLKKYNFSRVYVNDSMYYLKRGEKLRTSFNCYYESVYQCLYVHLPQLSRNNSFQAATHPLRCLREFKDKVQVLMVTENSNVRRPTIIKDVINVAGSNPLRGENDENFGPRFPDLSHICDQEMVNLLNAKDKFVLQEVYLSMELRRPGGICPNVVFSGNMYGLIVCCHMGLKVCGVIVLDQKDFSVVESIWFGKRSMKMSDVDKK